MMIESDGDDVMTTVCHTSKFKGRGEEQDRENEKQK
jgi:hypothetical protein